jgi:hypothetical protein
MKIQIINHRSDDIEMEVRNGIRIFDGNDKIFILSLNKFGELEINGADGALCVIPQCANEIIIKQQV